MARYLQVVDSGKLTVGELWRVDCAVDEKAGAVFSMPVDCRNCRKFDSALELQAHDSIFTTRRSHFLAQFRMTHHHPRFAFVDRSAEFLSRFSELGPSVRRELAVLVVQAEQA